MQLDKRTGVGRLATIATATGIALLLGAAPTHSKALSVAAPCGFVLACGLGTGMSGTEDGIWNSAYSHLDNHAEPDCNDLAGTLYNHGVTVYADSMYHAGDNWYYDGWSHPLGGHTTDLEMLTESLSIDGFFPILIHEATHYHLSTEDHSQEFWTLFDLCVN